MLRPRIFVAVVVNAALLLLSPAAHAQRHGGGAPSTGGGGLEAYSRPDGVSEKDKLKDFHDAMALQATPQQAAAFQSALKSTEAAKAEMQGLLRALGNADAADSARSASALDQALTAARSANNDFQDAFSPAQKSGLRDPLKRFAKADSDLDQEQKRLDQSLAAKSAAAEVSANAGRLDRVLTDFHEQQLALGRRMSIVLSSAQDVTFMLTQVKSPVRFGGQTISVPTSGRLLQVSAQNGRRSFRLELMSSLLDLQQNIAEIARAELNHGDRCGERVEVRNASLSPADVTGVLSVRLHYERWMCSRGAGQSISSELAEGDGVVEIKLTAAFDKQALKVSAEFGRIDASGMMADALRNGSLGDDLRDRAAQMLLSSARAGTDLKTVLPPALQGANIQSAKFVDADVGALTVVLNGHVDLSDEQVSALASQLNQALSAQAAASQ
jgi:hypothetical protein